MSILNDIIKSIESLFVTPPTSAQKAEYLDHRALIAGKKLDWQHSTADLLKLTGQDSSLDARKKLATELGHKGDFTGTAEENIWLHKQLMDHLKIT